MTDGGGTCAVARTNGGDGQWGGCRGTQSAHGLCQYTECSTIKGETCVFPFRFKGRLYDTCIMNDNLGSEPGKPWCSTAVDALGNHIAGSDQTCSDACERDSPCPIGFWRLYHEETCYQDSQAISPDTFKTFEEAEDSCAAQGARLFQFRSTEAFRYFENDRAETFNNDDFFRKFSKGVIAVSLKYTMKEGDDEKKFYYFDDTPVDPHLSEVLEWDGSYPEDNDNECVAMHRLKFQNVPCNGSTFFTATEDSTSDPILGYLCEAKPLKDKNNIYCHLPFYYNGIRYTSCSLEPVPGFNPNGKPWCAIEVDSDQNAVPGKWIMCEDEREIIYDGDGAGYKCPMPFLYDRIYYDYCTRKSTTSPIGFNDFYWCPDPNHVGENNLYTAGDPVGKCTEILEPPYNGCAELYDPVSNICVRISPYPETYEKAQAKCESEGSKLLYVLDEEVHVGLGEVLKEKIKKFPRYNDIKGMWLGADWETESGWKWRHSVTPFNGN